MAGSEAATSRDRFTATRSYTPAEFDCVLLFVILTLSCYAHGLSMPTIMKFASISSRVRPPESDFIRSLTHPSDQITVWGWNAYTLLGSGRASATRDLNMINLFHHDPQISAFYRDRFVRDMRRSPAEVFIDAVGVTSFPGPSREFESRQTGGFEVIPEINALVKANYIQIAEMYHQRFFLRRDLVKEPHMKALKNGGPIMAGSSTLRSENSEGFSDQR